ncbi:MAG: rod shape-determining protein MreC [Acidimicrobiales bacterium]
MAVYRRSRRSRFVLVLLVLTSVTVITLDFKGQSNGLLDGVRSGARDALAPVQSTADRVLNPVGNLFGGLTRYGKVKAENDRLRRQLAEAQAEGLRQAGSQRELDNLRALQNLSFAANIPTTAARVVSTAPSNFQVTVTIDKGSDQQVATGMPVVTGAGLVGLVADVSRTRATVLLVTDPSFNVGIRLQSSGEVAVARGDGADKPMPVDLVGLGAKVGPGEAAVTSGLQGSVFPPDVPVGRVRSAQAPAGALSQQVTLDPVADLDRLEFVKVLVWRSTP